MSSCPSRQELSAYVNGTSDQASAKTVKAHLFDCDQCLRRLDDWFELNLPKSETSDFDDEPEFKNARANIHSMFREFASTAETPNGVRSDTINQAPPPQLGEYRLVRRIGRGGMGVVYEAYHVELRRRVALKLLPQLSSASNEIAARFSREIAAAGRVDHRNVVRAFDARKVNGNHFLAMELIDGFDLHQIVSTLGPLDVGAACSVICQAAEGLGHAHNQGIIHRDVKPKNLMLCMDEQQACVKLLDLGIAHMHSEECHALSGDSRVMGTLDYMAPERSGDENPADHRVDVYGLGCTLYFLLVGRAPFAVHASPFAKVLAHNTVHPIAVSGIRNDCPLELSNFVEKMMQKTPSERVASTSDVHDALRVFADPSELPSLLQDERLRRLRNVSDAEMSSTALQWDLAELATAEPTQSQSPAEPSRKNRRQRSIFRRLGLTAFATFAILAAVVVNLRTKYGTLKINADESVAIAIENQSVQIRDKDRQRVYTLTVGESRMKPGEYEIVVYDETAGLKFTTRNFTITRNEATVVDARLEPNPIHDHSESSLAKFAFARAATSIRIRHSGGKLGQLRNRFEIPNEFKILELDFSHSRILTDDDLTHFATLPDLHTLTLADTLITDRGLENISKMKRIRVLDISRSEGKHITSRGIRALRKLSTLEILIAFSARFELAEVRELGQLKQVKRMTFSCADLTDDDMQLLRGMTSLENLHIVKSQLTGVGVRHLESNHNLRFIDFSSEKLTRAGVNEICNFQQLVELSLSGTVTTDMLDKLPQLQNLERLFLSKSAIDDDCVDLVTKLPKLEWLFVAQTPIGDGFVERLSTLPSLKRLGIANTQVTDAGLKRLSAANGLEFVDLNFCPNITLDGLKQLRDALPDCEIESRFKNR